MTHKMPPASQLTKKNKISEVVLQVESDLLHFQQNAYQEPQQTQHNIYSQPQPFIKWLIGENSSTSRGSSMSETSDN